MSKSPSIYSISIHVFSYLNSTVLMSLRSEKEDLVDLQNLLAKLILILSEQSTMWYWFGLCSIGITKGSQLPFWENFITRKIDRIYFYIHCFYLLNVVQLGQRRNNLLGFFCRSDGRVSSSPLMIRAEWRTEGISWILFISVSTQSLSKSPLMASNLRPCSPCAQSLSFSPPVPLHWWLTAPLM